MKGNLTLRQRLILPVILLGLISLLSNILAVSGINSVNASAAKIVDDYMTSEARLEEIRRSIMDIHRLALSHIVAADHTTMIQVVTEIKAEEAALEDRLADYAPFVSEADGDTYRTLLSDYQSFKHALVRLRQCRQQNPGGLCSGKRGRSQLERVRRGVHRHALRLRQRPSRGGAKPLERRIYHRPDYQHRRSPRRYRPGSGRLPHYSKVRHRPYSGYAAHPSRQLGAPGRRSRRGSAAGGTLRRQRSRPIRSDGTAVRRH